MISLGLMRGLCATLLTFVIACRMDPPPAGTDQGKAPSAQGQLGDPEPAAATPTLERAAAPVSPPVEIASIPTRFPAAPRVVAIGDVHGDLTATRRALRLAGAIGAEDRWIGDSLVVVQTGDQLDRGDEEQAILDLFDRLRREAKAAGGAFHALLGNHELMNVAGDLRYVTPGGFADFEGIDGLALDDPSLLAVQPQQRARRAAFMPGGPYAQILAQRNTVVIVGDNVFVHGGVLPEHVRGGLADLERLNADVRRWLVGQVELSAIAGSVLSPDAVVWTRLYAGDDPTICARLGEALSRLGAKRMIVGHTVQRSGITSGCDRRLWRIDVGMAAHYGGSVQVLQIEGESVKPLGLEG